MRLKGKEVSSMGSRAAIMISSGGEGGGAASEEERRTTAREMDAKRKVLVKGFHRAVVIFEAFVYHSTQIKAKAFHCCALIEWPNSFA